MMINESAKLETVIESDDELSDDGCWEASTEKEGRYPRRISVDSNMNNFQPNYIAANAQPGFKRCQSSFISPLTLLLDLDNTLISASLEPSQSYDFTISLMDDDGKPITLYITKRPHLDSFLSKISKIVNPYIFTASEPEYANQIISYLDPLGTIFVGKFYRNSCKQIQQNTYVKDISAIGAKAERTVLVDDSIESFGGHYENAVKIPAFTGDPHDRELDTLSVVVDRLRTFDDVRPLLLKINSR